jgi:hypothetical protein
MSRVIPEALRQAVIHRANGLCEYCQTSRLVVITMVIDHIQPVSKGGTTILDNLALACSSCNGHKYDFTTGYDPATELEAPLFNPRKDTWGEHFAWNEDGSELIGITPVGRATITRLSINDTSIIESRRLWIAAGWHPPKPATSV